MARRPLLAWIALAFALPASGAELLGSSPAQEPPAAKTADPAPAPSRPRPLRLGKPGASAQGRSAASQGKAGRAPQGQPAKPGETAVDKFLRRHGKDAQK